MAKEIKFNIKLFVDGKEQLATATADMNDMRGAMEKTNKSAQALYKNLFYLNQKIDFAKNMAEGMKNVASAIDTATSNIRELQQSYVSVAQATGLSGKELAQARAEAQAIADTFGGDLSEVLRASNSLAKGFGVSMDEALKLMKDGFISGANVNGEFLDTIREYPRYFKEAGISAEEFVAITTNAAKQGIYSDKGVDTIKEGNLRIREMTAATAQALEGIGISANDVQAQLQAGTLTTFQVMQMVAGKLKELPASASVVGTAIADIFGGPGEDAGLEYIKSLADIEMSMDKVCEGADEYSKALGDQMNMQTALNVALSGVQETLIGVNAKYGQLITIGGSLLSMLGNTVITLSAASAAFAKLASNAKVAAAAQTAWNGVAKMGRAVNIALSGSAHAAAGAAIALKLAVRGLLIATGVGAAIAALTFAVEKLMDALTSDEVDDFSKSLNGSKSVAESVAGTFRDTLAAEAANLQSKYRLLQEQWKALSTEQEKNKWIKENASAFDGLGLSIKGIGDAEDAFNNNTDKVVDALNKRAEAAAHAAAMQELYAEKFKLEDRIKDRNDAATRRHASGGKTYKAGDIVSGDDKIFNVIKGLIGKEVERVGKSGNQFRLTAYAAEKGNQYFTGKRYRSMSAAQKADEAALADNTKKIADHAQRQAELANESNDLLKRLGGGNGNAGRAGSGGSKGDRVIRGSNDIKDSDEVKEIANPLSEEALKSNISYYEEMRSKVEGNAEAYAEWTKKILEAQDALSALQGIASRVEIERDFNGKLGRGKASDLLKGSEGGGLLPQADSDTVLDTEIKGLDELQKKLEETREKGVDAFGALKGAWGGVQGIGDGIRNITSAIEDNGDAWSMITGIVNGVIQVFEGISGIVNIVKALTGATKEQTAAQQTDNAQKTEGIALSGAAAGATLTEAAAGEAKAGANASEAISGATKEGAKLAFPYNLIAIAAGVAAVVSALAMMSSFATGGIVGGSSTTGDKVLARVNSGEMILNRRQQENLLRILSSRQAVPVFSSVRAGGITGQDVSIDMGSLRSSLYAPTTRIEVTGRLRGKDLHLSQKNYEAVHRA